MSAFMKTLTEKNWEISRELPHFHIGSSYGGNQDWMIDSWMHIGGCGALTTCDICLDFALYKGRKELYPYDRNHLTRRDYIRFGMKMKPYLKPRNTGIKDLETYINGAGDYLKDAGASDISMKGLSGKEPYETARDTIKKQIDAETPVSYLMLNHRSSDFDFFQWHWFLVNGYGQWQDYFYIKAVTYGSAHWLPLRELWNTGMEEKGGIVIFECKE